MLTAPQAAQPPAPARRRIFISYKRDSEDDEWVAAQVHDALRGRHEVFIDRDIPFGEDWAARINDELQRADFLVVFLSEKSVASEMVCGEVERAYHLARERAGRPAIIPVRLAYRGAFNYPLNVYVGRRHAAHWAGAADTPRLVEQLLRAVEGGEPVAGGPETPAGPDAGFAPPPPQAPAAGAFRLEMPKGTMALGSKFYVTRKADFTALDAIARPGCTLAIEGPRQMGKSSLLVRVAAEAQRLGKHVAFLDFQLVDRATKESAERFFRHFSTWVADKLDLADRVEEFWALPSSHSIRCTRYMDRYVLAGLDRPLVLAMDEVDNLFDTPFHSDFFGMLRSWHNERARNPRLENLDLVLVTSTEPHLFIENLTQSPFNVAEEIKLADFTREQVGDLNARHGSPLSAAAVEKLMALLHGHPYLVRQALYLVASGQFSVADLFARAADDEGGPFADHLGHLIYRLHGRPDLVLAWHRVVAQQARPDERAIFRLRAAGLARKTERGVVPRCQLYADYLRGRLHA